MNIPHLHPMIVHFPTALLVVASVAGLLYLYGRRRPELLVLTWWCMAIGWAFTLAAILTGLLDQRAIAPDAPFRPVLNRHIGSGLMLFMLYGWILYRRRIFNSRKARRARGDEAQITELLDYGRARLWVTAALLTGMVLVFISGWNGGQLVYEWGVNVDLPQP